MASSYYARSGGVTYTFDRPNYEQVMAAVKRADYSVRAFARWTEAGEAREGEVTLDLTKPPDLWWSEEGPVPRRSSGL
jgi:hypothetical protein